MASVMILYADLQGLSLLHLIAGCSSAKIPNFDFMQVQVDIPFDELLKIVKTLPRVQLRKLKSEIEKETKTQESINLEALLLNGPVATKKQLETIENNTKAINQWRTK